MNSANEGPQTPQKQQQEKISYLSIINEKLTQTKSDVHFNEKIMQASGLDYYRIYEDLCIIYEIAGDESDGTLPRFWQDFEQKKVLNRTFDSMRDRYKNYLAYLTKEDFDLIMNYINNTSNLYGFLIFAKAPNMQKIFEKIQDENEFKKKSQNKSIAKETKINKRLFQELINENKTKISNIEKKINPTFDDMSSYEDMEVQVNHQKRFYKKIKLEQPQGSKQKSSEINEQKKMIVNLMNKYHLTSDQFFEQLNKACGSIKTLTDALQNKNQNLLWSEQEDKYLQNTKCKTDIHYTNLIQKKSLESIRQRLQFLRWELPFKF